MKTSAIALMSMLPLAATSAPVEVSLRSNLSTTSCTASLVTIEACNVGTSSSGPWFTLVKLHDAGGCTSPAGMDDLFVPAASPPSYGGRLMVSNDPSVTCETVIAHPSILCVGIAIEQVRQSPGGMGPVKIMCHYRGFLFGDGKESR
jgi:hypothetical protein